MAKLEKIQEQKETDFFLQERANIVGLKRDKDESVSAFRSRVAGALRAKGHIIEAHEALSGKLYDDPEQGPLGPITGIFGAVAQAMQDKSYSKDPEQKVGDDLAVGALVRAGEDPTKAMFASLLSLHGPEASMDVINGLTGQKKEFPPEKLQAKMPKKPR